MVLSSVIFVWMWQQKYVVWLIRERSVERNVLLNIFFLKINLMKQKRIIIVRMQVYYLFILKTFATVMRVKSEHFPFDYQNMILAPRNAP